MNIDNFFEDYGNIFAQGNQTNITAFLHESLVTANAAGDKHALVTILNEAAGYYRNASRYDEAVAAGERALTLLREMGYEDSVAYGTTLLNVATAYRAAGESEIAMGMFISSLATLGALLPEDDYRLAGLYNNISAIHQEQENWQSAFEMLLTAATIMESNSDMVEDTAIVLTNLSFVLFRLGRAEEGTASLKKAETMFHDAANTGRKNGRLAPHYAAALAGIGEEYFRMKEFEKAARTYELAIEHISKAFGKNTDYAVTCHNCADAWEAAGHVDKSQTLRNQAETVLAEENCSGVVV